MNTLIIYAHPEPTSLNAAMKQRAADVLAARRHEVVISDLYAMAFNPVAGPGDMTQPMDRLRFHLQIEQSAAARHNTLSDDIRREQDRVRRAELLIFQFPMWWYSVPAIMKGWIDRVLSYGFAYGEGASLQGKHALIATTTGGPEHSYQPGMRGSVEHLLAHLTEGTFALCGIQALPPFAVYAAARISEQQRKEALDNYEKTLLALLKE